MQLEQLKQDRVEMQAFQKHLADSGGNPDLKQFATMLLKSPKHYEKGVEMLQKLQEQDKFDAYLKRTQLAAAPAAPGMLGSGTAGIMPAGPAPTAPPAVNALAPSPGGMLAAAPVPVNALAAQPTLADLEANYRAVSGINTLGAKSEAEMIKDQIKIMRTPQIVSAGSTVLANGRPVYTAPEKAAAPPSMVAEYTFAKTPDGGNFRGSYQDFVTARAAAGRAPAQPAQPSAPVAVVDENGKVKYVTREQAMGMTPASALEGLAPKEIQAREAKYPAATSAVKTFESSSEKLAADLERLATHPGLSGISGLIFGRTPAVTKEARQAEALYKSIVARGGFQELQNMRASSPTGGALGNVSNQEGQYLRDAFAPIQLTQDTPDLKTALENAAVTARTAKQRVREAYDMTYDYKNQGGARPAPAAGGAAPAAGGGVVDFGSLR
jgi:hypothetical protein